MNDEFKISIAVMITSANDLPEYQLFLERIIPENEDQDSLDKFIEENVICPYVSTVFSNVVGEAVTWAKFLNTEFVLDDMFKQALKINGKIYPCPYSAYVDMIYIDYRTALEKAKSRDKKDDLSE